MIIVKVGGGEAVNLRGIASDVKSLDSPCIIVHGANALRDRLAAQLGVEKRVVTSLSGYSSVVSDDSLIDLMMMAYAGLKNKQLVELLQQAGVNGIGLSGLDGALVRGKRNSGIKTRQDGKNIIIRDRSGKPKEINGSLLKLLLDNGYLPVLTVPILDENSVAINSENDDIVACLQGELGAATVVQLIEAPGLLDNAEDPKSLIPSLSVNDLKEREELVSGRIKRKLLSLSKLFVAGVEQVIIADGRVDSPIKNALEGRGTVIR